MGTSGQDPSLLKWKHTSVFTLPKWDIVSMPRGFLLFLVGPEDVKHVCIMSAWKQVSPPSHPIHTHIHTLQCGQQQAHYLQLESDLSLPPSSLVLLLPTQHRHGGNLLHGWLVPLQLQQSLELENVSSHKCPAYPFIDISFHATTITRGK